MAPDEPTAAAGDAAAPDAAGETAMPPDSATVPAAAPVSPSPSVADRLLGIVERALSALEKHLGGSEP